MEKKKFLAILNQSLEIASKKGYKVDLDRTYNDVKLQKYFSHLKKWNSHNKLIITSQKIKSHNFEEVVVTPYVYEYSWAVDRLENIYKPKGIEKEKFYPTMGVILNSLQKNHSEDVEKVLQKFVLLSSLYLHPKHIYGFEFLK